MICAECGRSSHEYPAFPNERPYTGEFELPTWSHRFRCYGRFTLHLDWDAKKTLTDEEGALEMLARSISTPDMIVGVPRFTATKPPVVAVTPAPSCPFCGAAAEVRFGHLQESENHE